MTDKTQKAQQARFEELRFHQLAQAMLKAVYRLAQSLPDYESTTQFPNSLIPNDNKD